MFLTFIRKQLLVIVILVSLFAALAFPESAMKFEFPFFGEVLLFTIFLCQGMGIDFRTLKLSRKTYYLILIGFFVSLFLMPAMAWGLMQFSSMEKDYVIGFLLMSAMAPTLVSGTVMASDAGGDRPTGLMLTVTLNFLGVLIIPFSLDLIFGHGVALQRLPLFTKLFCFVLIPSIIGGFITFNVPKLSKKLASWTKTIPIYCLGLFLYISCAKQSELFLSTPAQQLLEIIPWSLFLHLSILIFLYYSALKFFKWPRNLAITLSLIASQKTLPIAIAVWTVSLQTNHPLAVLPPIVFHFTQLFFDSFIVARWKLGSLEGSSSNN